MKKSAKISIFLIVIGLSCIPFLVNAMSYDYSYKPVSYNYTSNYNYTSSYNSYNWHSNSYSYTPPRQGLPGNYCITNSDCGTPNLGYSRFQFIIRYVCYKNQCVMAI